MATLDFALLCNSAFPHQGTVSILAAGLNGITAPQLPAQIPVSVVGRLIWDSSELGQVQLIRIVVHHVDGEPIGSVNIEASPEAAPQGMPSIGMFTAAVPLLVRRPGVYQYEIHLNGTNLKTLEIVVTAALPTP